MTDFKRKKTASKFYSTEVLAYISKNYDRNLTLEKVANDFDLNKCYFCSVLKKELGKTFSQIVNEIRIENSKPLLEECKLSILDVALTVGYNNQNYFNMAFKKSTGVTPLEYRRMSKKGSNF